MQDSQKLKPIADKKVQLCREILQTHKRRYRSALRGGVTATIVNACDPESR